MPEGLSDERRKDANIRQSCEQRQKADDRKREPPATDEQTDDHERKPQYDT